MKNSDVIDALIIDTSALERTQFDILGLNSARLKTIFELAKKRNIILLTHPILKAEVKKHMGGSKLIETTTNLKKALTKYKSTFDLIELSVEEIKEKIDVLDLCNEMEEAFQDVYSEAVILPFPNAETIFNQYFECLPPFDNKKNKKNEFPDAFILQAIKQYMKEEPLKKILVITGDEDWRGSLCKEPNIILEDSIDAGIRLIQGGKNVSAAFKAVLKDVEKAIREQALLATYELNDYEIEGNLEIIAIAANITDEMITPLVIESNFIKLETVAQLEIAGKANVIKDSELIRDKFNSLQLITVSENITFEKATAEVTCEVEIAFDAPDIEKSAQLKSLKLNTFFDIPIDVEQKNIIIEEPSFNDVLDMIKQMVKDARH